MTTVRYRLFASRLLGNAALVSALAMPIALQAQTSPDNSAANQAQGNTADQQSSAASDRMLTKKIRQALMADKSLSTYGHNVKIITKDGSVTLKGPVHSEDEKQTIASKAQSIVGSPDRVTNQLTVAQ